MSGLVAVRAGIYLALWGTSCSSDRAAEMDAAAFDLTSVASTMPDGTVSDGPRKHALIIAVAEQGEALAGAHAYRRLNGPGADAVLVGAALQHHGFDPENIVTLRDDQATKDGITAALRDLVERTNSGDIVVVHYSGHGHQVTDDNGDEIDGYDEVLVPYGAPDYSLASEEIRGSYGGERHIRDDELGVLLGRLSAKVGRTGSLVVFLDACFSGTGTRGPGQMVARGGERPIGQPARPSSEAGESRGGGFAETPGTRGSGTGGPDALGYVVLSAASHQQKAYETYHSDGRTIVGTLSHALSVALPRMRPGASYRELHSQIVEVIRGKQPGQSPQIEGAADLEIFGNLLTEHETWVRVAGDDGDGRLALEAGELRGLGIGSEVEIRGAVGSDQIDARLATGTVVQSSPLSSVVELDAPYAAGSDLTGARAFVTRESFGDLSAKIVLDESVDSVFARMIRDSLEGRWIVSVTTEVDADADGVVSQERGRRVQLRSAHDGMPVGNPVEVLDGRGAGRFASHVESFARNAYLRKLNPQDPSIDVSLSLHPWAGDPSRCREDRNATDFVNEIRLSPGEAYFLKVTNHGDSEPYFAVLDLMPDGDVGQLVPDRLVTMEEARLAPRQEFVLPGCWAVEPVPGIEVLKLFATRDPVDFRPLIASRGRSHRAGGPPSDLERLFSETHARTRSERAGARPAMASVSSVVIEVVVLGTDTGGGR